MVSSTSAKAAAIVTKGLNGAISDDFYQFKNLPGVGDYIGAAVQSIPMIEEESNHFI
ncbi:hypothetical protein [Desulfobacula sp.]|uniref:hypothetical protein n=1 Tax=Desulfobacula sp. TaxID=2593537 RepID=UPI002620B277|nr:hypothetical protein [Desulfobacula sp.]